MQLNLYCAIALLLPAVVLMALHWFPWVDAINRELHRLESYVLGVATINGTALALILLAANTSPESSARFAALLLALATASGGGGTLLAWGIDYIVRQRRSQRRISARQAIAQREANAE